MVYFVDTNVFLRVIVKENEKVYFDCFNFLKSVEESKFSAYSSHIVLAEIVWTLTSYYKLSKLKVVKSLRAIEKMGLTITNRFDTGEAHPKSTRQLFQQAPEL